MNKCVSLFAISAFLIFGIAFGDEKFDKLLEKGKWDEAIRYADESIPPSSRTADIWSKLAKANENSGMPEKALACYVFSLRLSDSNYEALLGSARLYNKMNQPDRALEIAKKATKIQLTAEAGWEYAKACIALGRPAEAKDALVKVLESDPTNVIANRELGTRILNLILSPLILLIIRSRHRLAWMLFKV